MLEALQHVNIRVANPISRGKDDVRLQAPAFKVDPSRAT